MIFVFKYLLFYANKHKLGNNKYSIIFLKICLTSGLLFLQLTAKAQWASYEPSKKKIKSIEYYIPTDNISIKRKRSVKPQRKLKNYMTIYLNAPEGKMYGNQCVLEVTRKFGFEYAIESKNNQGSIPQGQVFFKNLAVKTYLVFIKSPFWKAILLKRINQCKQQAGDFVG